MVAIGRKGLGQMARRGYEIIDEIAPLGGEPNTQVVWRLAGRIGAKYLAGEIDQRGAGLHEVPGRSLLSRCAPTCCCRCQRRRRTSATPSSSPIRSNCWPGLMDRYLRTALLGAVLEASTSEHAARVAAMTAATDNAEEMIQDLTMDYNKARQAGITKELTEIVSGAEATA